MNFAELKVGKTYSLSTKVPAIFGASLKKLKFEAATNYDLAKQLEVVDQVYSQVYPSLPAPKVYAPKNETYYVFRQLNGTRIILAETWIVESSITEISSIPIQIQIADGKTGDIQRIKTALTALGFSEFTINEA